MLKLIALFLLIPSLLFAQGVWDNTLTTAELDISNEEFVITFDGLSLTSNIKNPDCLVVALVRRNEALLYDTGDTDPGIDYMGYTAVEGIPFGFRSEQISDVAPYITTMECLSPTDFTDGFDVRYRFSLYGVKSGWFIIQATVVP